MSDWGKGAKNNTIGFGSAACTTTNNWGKSQKDSSVAASWSGDTDISGCSGGSSDLTQRIYNIDVTKDPKQTDYPYRFEFYFNATQNTNENITIDWGDGTIELVNVGNGNNQHIGHTYTDVNKSLYTVKVGKKDEATNLKIWGFYPYQTNAAGDSIKPGYMVCEFVQWGDGLLNSLGGNSFMPYCQWIETDKPKFLASRPTTFVSAFYQNTENISYPSLPTLDISNATNLTSMFYANRNFITAGSVSGVIDVSSWDTSNVTISSNLFMFVDKAGLTEIKVSKFNTSSLLKMLNMFYGVKASILDCATKVISAADSPTGSSYTAWDVTSVTNFRSSFYGCSNFNADLSTWNVSSNCISIYNMFSYATKFNRDISGWDTSNCGLGSYLTGFTGVFLYATAFNQNLSAWVISPDWNTSGTGNENANMVGCFSNSGMSTENYTDTLVGWAVQVYKNQAPFNVNASSQLNMTFDNARTSDNASGQTYLIKYGADWTNTGWANSGAALTFLTTATASEGAGWTYSD